MTAQIKKLPKMKHPDPVSFVCRSTGRTITFAGGATAGTIPGGYGADGKRYVTPVELLPVEVEELLEHPYFGGPRGSQPADTAGETPADTDEVSA